MSDNQPVQTNQPSRRSRSHFGIVIAAILLITVLAVLLANYNPLVSHVTTVTQQQFITNTQNVYSTQTVTNVGIITSQTTMTSTTTYPIGSGYSQNCGYSTCYPYPQYGYNGYYNGYNSYYNGYYYYGQSPYYCSYNYNSCYVNGPSQYSYNSACQSTSSNNTSQCSGYLHQDQNGCVELSVPLYSPYNTAQVYQYYTLNNLPSSYPPIGSWVTVTGQVYPGSSPGFPYGTACPGNYINVTSIS